MNAKLKRFKTLHNILITVYILVFISSFYSLAEIQNQRIIPALMFLLGVFIISEISSREIVSKFLEELGKEQEPRRIRVRVHGFKGDEELLGGAAYMATFLITRNGEFIPTDDFELRKIDGYKAQQLLGSPVWNQIVGNKKSIAMCGRVYTTEQK